MSLAAFNPCIVLKGDGEKLKAPGIDCTFKITGAHSGETIGIYELVLQPHQPGAVLHYHKYIHETFVIVKGKLLMQWEEEFITLAEGSMLHVPPCIHHGFSNDSDEETRLLLIFTPASGREEFFRRLYKNLANNTYDDQLREPGEKYDTWYGH